LEHPIAQKLDDKELVHPQEFMMANAIQVDAVTQLLIEKGIITAKEFFAKLKEVQIERDRRRTIRRRAFKVGVCNREISQI
jgi:hypothetical protein